MVDQTDERRHDPAHDGREHGLHAGHMAGQALGKGLGGLVLLAGLIILFGPFLLAPLTLAIQAWRALQPDPWWSLAAAIVVGVGVVGVQLLAAIQRQPVVRVVTVALFSFIFLVAAWLLLTPDNVPVAGGYPPPEGPGFEIPPWYERITRTGWIVIAVGTALYSALYLFLLHRLDDRPWARRLQLFRSKHT